eukprot:TRINITY_DN443_c0_g1_i1.p1 TRINITY_DN443_c0_g1~~TRINITY_DN443_c0_g1_i1.p1  ORF type:complete len:102 (-),score=8.27 TRINITY_DN443_c0_g1_i1:866-1171(-)
MTQHAIKENITFPTFFISWTPFLETLNNLTLEQVTSCAVADRDKSSPACKAISSLNRPSYKECNLPFFLRTPFIFYLSISLTNTKPFSSSLKKKRTTHTPR